MAQVKATYINAVMVDADDSDPSVANLNTLRGRAQTALTANATFLAIGSPSNAQTVAQVQTLSRQCSAVIRLLLNQLDSTAGT